MSLLSKLLTNLYNGLVQGVKYIRTFKIYQVDSFTKYKFKGNPAGVVLNADGLSDKEMISIARELNNSETAFLFSPDGPDHEVKVRFFTPKTEVPICGHATLAAHYVRAVKNNLNTVTVMQKTGIGVLPVDIIKENDDYFIMMTQGEVRFSEPFVAGLRNRIFNALGLKPDDMDHRCPLQMVSTGNPKVMVGIRSRKVLNSIAPDMQTLVEISKSINCSGYFLFTLDSGMEGILTHGRMFAPAAGINEDPVTGNAHAPLGAYLFRHRLVVPDGSKFSFKGEQGYSLGRSGIVEVMVTLDKGEPKEIKIGGKAVIVFETIIEI